MKILGPLKEWGMANLGIGPFASGKTVQQASTTPCRPPARLAGNCDALAQPVMHDLLRGRRSDVTLASLYQIGGALKELQQEDKFVAFLPGLVGTADGELKLLGMAHKQADSELLKNNLIRQSQSLG